MEPTDEPSDEQTTPPVVCHPWPFDHCPLCREECFTVEAVMATTVFTCTCCGQRWRYLLGSLIPVQAAPPAPPAPGDGPDDRPATVAAAAQDRYPSLT